MTKVREIELDIDGDGESDVKIEEVNGHKIWLNLTSLRNLAIVIATALAGLVCYNEGLL